MWTRGSVADWEQFADAVGGDPQWNFQSLLPYFTRSEQSFDMMSKCPVMHGTDGPIRLTSVTTSGRVYPLKETVARAYEEIGVKRLRDINAGTTDGIGELVENLRDGKRQLTSAMYSLHGVEVITGRMGKRIILSRNEQGELRATGIELDTGEVLTAREEVILTAGAYRTPQLLMLSGIGPPVELERHGIPVQSPNEHVGKHFHDHFSVSLVSYRNCSSSLR